MNVATRVVKKLDLTDSPRDLLQRVQAQPVAQSNIVAITAKADSPDGARDLANAFMEEAIAEQTKQIDEAIDATLPSLKQSADAGGPRDSQRPQLATRAAGRLRRL